MFGPAQAAVAKAVMDCVSDGLIPKDQAEDILIIVSVFIEWDAKDKKKVYDFNYQATKFALERAITGKPIVQEILVKKESSKHPFT